MTISQTVAGEDRIEGAGSTAEGSCAWCEYQFLLTVHLTSFWEI